MGELIAKGAWLQIDEVWEALHSISLSCQSILSTIDLDELDLFTILSLELVDYAVPLRHELDTVVALWHEKVDDDNGVFVIAQQLLEVLCAL